MINPQCLKIGDTIYYVSLNNTVLIGNIHDIDDDAVIIRWLNDADQLGWYYWFDERFWRHTELSCLTQ
jgi:hypothetical protein